MQHFEVSGAVRPIYGSLGLILHLSKYCMFIMNLNEANGIGIFLLGMFTTKVARNTPVTLTVCMKQLWDH